MQAPVNIGVDVSKAKIDIFVVEEARARRCLPNARAALDKWLSSVPPGSHIAMEASGKYHELLAELAHARGLQVFVLNPKDVRHYAKSMGLRAKTDRVDAAVIARLVAKEHARLHRFCPLTGEQLEMLQLIRRRAKVSSMHRAAQESFQDIAALDKPLQALLGCLDRLTHTIDARLVALTRACPQRREAIERLRTIDGVGPLVSAALLSYLERIPFCSADAFVAYHGLDTRVDESGTRAGRRRLSKRGPGEMRRLLYNAAMAGIKTKAWKPVYEHYLERGWPPTAALMIIARRILRTAWSIYKHNTTFDPTRPMAGLT
jgi:transposase